MASFAEDLAKAFHLTTEISSLRAQQWRPIDVDPLLKWQVHTFAMLATGEGMFEIERAWGLLRDDPRTQEQAALFHEELSSVLAFEVSVLELRTDTIRPGVGAPQASLLRRVGGHLKRAVGLFKTFLESLKDILGDVLSLPWRIALQIAIEASEVFAK